MTSLPLAVPSQLDGRLRHLRLSGMAESLPGRLQQATGANLAHREFLELLVQDELARRSDRLFARRLKQAGLAAVQDFSDFDWTYNPKLPRARLCELATGHFVAAHHGILLIGPPGEGKSLLANALPGILPRLTDEEKVELTKIYSACGGLERDGVAVTRRPMRSIHHTASKQSLVGGGSKVPRPGEITYEAPETDPCWPGPLPPQQLLGNTVVVLFLRCFLSCDMGRFKTGRQFALQNGRCVNVYTPRERDCVV